MKNFFIISFLILFSSSVFANYKYSFEECLQISDGVNAETPMVLSDELVMDFTTCMSFDDGAWLIYMYQTSWSKNQLGPGYKQRATKNMCENPDTYNLLLGLKDVQYQFSSFSGEFINNITLKADECR